MSLLKNIRFYVLVFSLVFSVAAYIYTRLVVPEGSLQIIRLTEIYALTAVTFLYLAVIAGPLVYVLPMLPFRGQYMKARRAIGVSAFYFGFLHGYLAFFGQLGGFAGLPFLSSTYIIAITLSFTALVILGLMASTSFDVVVAKLTFPRWKFLHRFVYLVILLITIHALMLGSHFTTLTGPIPQIFLSALAILLLLEANRFDAFLERKFRLPEPVIEAKVSPTKNVTPPTPKYAIPHYGISVIAVLVVIACYFMSTLGIGGSDGGLPSLNIHSQHIQLAKDAQQAATSSQTNQASLPPFLQGDKTKRFTVSFLHPEVIVANTDTHLQFLVNDASSGNPVNFFTKFYEKPLHLIIVDSSLQYFTHIHPEQIAGGFDITTQFPKDGVYHLYQDFQPVGAIEQQFAFTLPVGQSLGEGRPVGATSSAVPAQFIPDISGTTKQFGDYEVTLNYQQPLKADQITIGNQKLTFTVKDAKTHQGLTNLKPYLAAFGHLVMINEQSFDYIHVHPSNLTTPAPDATSGPVVDFLPLGLYSPIKPGMYRLFAQFNPDGKLFTADFTVSIQ